MVASQPVTTFGSAAVLSANAPVLTPAFLAALYDQFGSRAYALAVRMLGDREAAADIVETVFLEHSFTAEASDEPQVRLLAAVHRHCVARRAVDGTGLNQGSKGIEPVTEHATVTALMPLSAETARLQRATNVLATDQYQALSLAYFDGLNCSQIAAALALSPAAARQLLRRGLEALATVPVSAPQA